MNECIKEVFRDLKMRGRRIALAEPMRDRNMRLYHSMRGLLESNNISFEVCNERNVIQDFLGKPYYLLIPDNTK
jgi:hypothetical protein